MKILITICARGGSKGIPGKNVRRLNGHPLIGYTIKSAQQFANDRDAVIALSTDSDEIKDVAAGLGLSTNYKRPSEFATDKAGKIETIRHLLDYEEQRMGERFDYVLDLDVTSPLRTQDDLEAGFKLLSENENAKNLFSVNHAARNPYFNMVESNKEGYVELVKKGNFLSRQEAPAVYDLNASFYFYRRSFFGKDVQSTITDRSMVYVMPHICFDLDHEIDFEFLSFLLEHNKLNFQLFV